MRMATEHPGKVEYRDNATLIHPAVDEVDADSPAPTGFREKLRAAYDQAKLEAQMKGKIQPKPEFSRSAHYCTFWKLSLHRLGGKILMQRVCASYKRGDDEFIGCGNAQSFDWLPEREARIKFAEMKRSGRV
jgi:hypothetical protein